ncbi:MAG TPA: hypothetical protein VGB83_01585 [Actinomycetota bacterium]
MERNGASSIVWEDLETELSKIPSVTAVKIFPNNSGEVQEVHVLAGRDRAAKQIVRDIQSVAVTRFGLEIDYRKVSVVQLDDGEGPDEPTGPERDGRVILDKVSIEVVRGAVLAKVTMSLGTTQIDGESRGPAGTETKAVSRAVIDGLSRFTGDAVVDVEVAEVIEAGSYRIAISILRTGSSRGPRTSCGTAIVHRDPIDAIARASLAALNRLVRPE